MVEERAWSRSWTIASVVIGGGVLALAIYIAVQASGSSASGGDEGSARRYRVTVGGAPVKGPPDALVTIVIFSDFQCPHCRDAAATVTRLLERSPGDVRVAFRHAPMAGAHPQAQDAAAAAMAAHAQGRFWEYHDLLFAHQAALGERGDELFVELARQLGLDVERFRTDLARLRESGPTADDQRLLRELDGGVVPALFINGRLVLGAVPLEELQAVVEQERRRARDALARGVERNRLYESLTEIGGGV